jgi:putative tryptophan/tyrosine transport system substrate-binding protein
MGSGVNAISIVVLVLVALLMPLAADTQQAGKVYRVGYLGPSTKEDYAARSAAFAHRLRELGYVEGQNLVIEYRWAEMKSDRYKSLAVDLVRSNVDVIVTPSTATIRAAMGATKTIPIVMSGGSDPVGSGLVASLARPGGNVTGTTSSARELIGKRLGLLREVAPRVSRVAVLGISGYETALPSLKEAEAEGRSLGIQIHPLLVRGVGELEEPLAAAIKGGANALLMLSGPLAAGDASGRRIAELALKNRLPSVSPFPGFVRQGGLMCYGVDVIILHRHAAVYVDKILKGAKPAELPVERPKEFALAINPKTAKAIGVTIPSTILASATEVIE